MLIVAGRLLAVDRAITAGGMAGARVIELRDDQYVLPGFFDVHAHYNMTLGASGVRSDEYTYNPLIFLANGVTSTFPAGEYDPEGMMAARKRIDAGEQIGPRIYNSGPYFGTARRGWNQNATTADIYRDVDEWAAKGARAFKAKGIAPQHLAALVERAHLHGLTVTAHLESGFRNSTNARDAILMGIDRVEHILGGDQLDSTKTGVSVWSMVDTSSKQFKDIVAAVHLAPRDVRSDDHRARLLLAAAGRIRLLDRRAEVLHARGAGVGEDEAGAARGRVVGLALLGDASNDEGVLRRRRHAHPRHRQSEHGRVHRRLLGAPRAAHARARSAFPPAAALKIATINGARALGVSDKLGTIEVGKLADLFVVRGNPLADIKNTRNVQLVMKSGFVYDPKELLAQAEGKIGPPPQARSVVARTARTAAASRRALRSARTGRRRRPASRR